jgi:hypothetical protein
MIIKLIIEFVPCLHPRYKTRQSQEERAEQTMPEKTEPGRKSQEASAEKRK